MGMSLLSVPVLGLFKVSESVDHIDVFPFQGQYLTASHAGIQSSNNDRQEMAMTVFQQILNVLASPRRPSPQKAQCLPPPKPRLLLLVYVTLRLIDSMLYSGLSMLATQLNDAPL